MLLSSIQKWMKSSACLKAVAAGWLSDVSCMQTMIIIIFNCQQSATEDFFFICYYIVWLAESLLVTSADPKTPRDNVN
jgi:hypothetical protein